MIDAYSGLALSCRVRVNGPSVLLLADGCEAVDNPLIELIVAELANAELSFALFKLVLNLDLALNAGIWLIRAYYARASR